VVVVVVRGLPSVVAAVGDLKLFLVLVVLVVVAVERVN